MDDFFKEFDSPDESSPSACDERTCASSSDSFSCSPDELDFSRLAPKKLILSSFKRADQNVREPQDNKIGSLTQTLIYVAHSDLTDDPENGLFDVCVSVKLTVTLTKLG